MELLRAGTPARGKLDAIQALFTETKRTMRSVEDAPLALEDARANVRAGIERAAGDDEWALSMLLGFGHTGGRNDLPRLKDGSMPWAALIAVLGAKEVEDRIVKLIMAEPGERGLPAAKRQAKLAELRAKLDELERQEEREVLALEEAGYVVLRRADVRPDLLMSMWQAMSPPTPAPRPANPADAPFDPAAINEGRHLNRSEAQRSG